MGTSCTIDPQLRRVVLVKVSKFKGDSDRVVAQQKDPGPDHCPHACLHSRCHADVLMAQAVLQ